MLARKPFYDNVTINNFITEMPSSNFIYVLIVVVQFIVSNLRRNFFETHLSSFPTSIFNHEAIRAARSLRELDELLTIKLHDYPSTKDYYDEQGCQEVLKDIRVPLLLVNSHDDPVSFSTLIPYREM